MLSVCSHSTLKDHSIIAKVNTLTVCNKWSLSFIWDRQEIGSDSPIMMKELRKVPEKFLKVQQSGTVAVAHSQTICLLDPQPPSVFREPPAPVQLTSRSWPTMYFWSHAALSCRQLILSKVRKTLLSGQRCKMYFCMRQNNLSVLWGTEIFGKT